MNKKLIFRVLGALASSLAIVAVFVPYISVRGYSRSIWETNQLSGSMYLPIMIIVFGVIGVIFFSLNIKTEFAYASAGALTFYIVMETIDVMNQNAFNTLGIGYYFLIISTVLMGLMAFLTNLKSNKKVVESVQNTSVNQSDVLSNIDRLYNNVQSQMPPIQPVQNITVQTPLENHSQEMHSEQNLNGNINSEMNTQHINQNPMNNELNEHIENPVVQGFTNSVNPQTKPIQQSQSVDANAQKSVNPVVQGFMNSNSSILSNNNSNNSSETDIFGQPINR